MLRRFLPYRRHFQGLWLPLVGGLLCGIIAGAASGGGIPIAVQKAFGTLFAGEAVPDNARLYILAALIPTIMGVRGLFGFLNIYLLGYCGVRVLERLRIDLFAKFQRLPLAFFQKRSTGDLVSRAVNDTQQLQAALTAIVGDAIKQPVQLVGALGALAYLTWQNHAVLILLLNVFAVPLVVLPIRVLGRNLRRRAHQASEQFGVITERNVETVAAAREIRAFSLESREEQRFQKTSRSLLGLQVKVIKYNHSISPSIEFVASLGLAFSAVYAATAGISFDIFLGMAAALYMAYEPAKKIGEIYANLQRGSAALDRLEDILREPEPIRDPERPLNPGPARGRLSFESVSFTYGEGPVLREVSAEIPSGTVCALVGPSGAGKSTFAALVPRFYDVTSGRLLIDGADVRDLRLADLRSRIAIVPQDPFLFNDTIHQNILLGRPGASREEVEQAARDAFAHDFISDPAVCPLGYDTVVGERGTRMSGGQKQRIALARAFLRNAPILILDEATSALDAQSEQAVQAALRKLVIGRTVLIIAHRFSTIRDASLILVFEQGRIVARGSHGELYGSSPLYRELYDRQR